MKGVSGYKLAVIVTIIIAIALVALFIIFQDVFIKGITQIFGNVVDSFLASVRGILGPWADIFLPGL